MAVGEAGVEREQRLGRRPVGAVDEERPVEPAADQRQPLAERGEPVLVVGAVLLGAADDVARAGLGIEELGAAGIGEGLLDRVDDLDEMGAGAGADDGVERRLGLGRADRGSRRTGRRR